MNEISSQLDAARDRLKAESPAPDYLTKAEAAELARCSTKTIQKAVHSGQLRAFRPASRLLFLESDVRSWVESRAASPAERPRPSRTRSRRVAPGSVTALREIESRLG